MRQLEPIAIEHIRAARERIAGLALRTPLVRLGLIPGRTLLDWSMS